MPEPDDLHPWHLREEKVIGRFRIFDVAEEWYDRPDGKPVHSFFVIRTADWANVVPVTPDGKVVLIRQFRPGTGEITVEVPGGMVEPAEGGDVAVAALRELEEETGYVAERIEPLASIRPNPAILRNWQHHFVAHGARKARSTRFDEGEDVRTFEATWDEVDAMVRDGRISHSLTLTALLFARYLKS
jgi:8-oxo-dGTP pyrophosphatase MutT (NUDIX family)